MMAHKIFCSRPFPPRTTDWRSTPCVARRIGTARSTTRDEFPLTQEFAAMMLGAARPTVTVVAGIMQKAA